MVDTGQGKRNRLFIFVLFSCSSLDENDSHSVGISSYPALVKWSNQEFLLQINNFYSSNAISWFRVSQGRPSVLDRIDRQIPSPPLLGCPVWLQLLCNVFIHSTLDEDATVDKEYKERRGIRCGEKEKVKAQESDDDGDGAERWESSCVEKGEWLSLLSSLPCNNWHKEVTTIKISYRSRYTSLEHKDSDILTSFFSLVMIMSRSSKKGREIQWKISRRVGWDQKRMSERNWGMDGEDE